MCLLKVKQSIWHERVFVPGCATFRQFEPRSIAVVISVCFPLRQDSEKFIRGLLHFQKEGFAYCLSPELKGGDLNVFEG